MKLLICTQAVDQNDPVLGFFVRWIAEFAKHCEKVVVVCLREGRHSLPGNVDVLALGKAPRLLRTVRLWRISIARRREYDAVFVHMNPEYIVAAGLLWRLMHKRIALWYTHKSVNLRLRLAAFFADAVCTASKESFRLQNGNVHVMGHGIDTDFFSPDPSIARGDWALSVGRLMRSKRHDLAIAMAAQEHRELRIAGEGPERRHLEALVRKQGGRVSFLGGVDQARLRDEYRKAAYLIHTSETGSLDKVVLEALACGLPVRTNDPALKVLEDASPAYVREQHSLQHLIPALVDALCAPRVAFLFTNAKDETISRVQEGQDADTVLHGMNHIPGAEHLTASPKSMRSALYLPRLLRYDVIIAQDNFLLGYAVSRCARMFGLKTRWLYVAIHSSTLMRRHAAHPVRLFLFKKFWASYAHIICISSEQLEDFVRFGIPREHLVFVPFGVDARFFQPAAASREEDLIVSVGRDTGRDYATLFAAAGRTSRPFIVVASHKNILSHAPIPANVSVRYDRSLREIRDLYRRARMVVIASKDTNQPDGSDCSGQTVILDALAVGKAVIATRRPWIADYFVSGQDLMVVPPNDPEALARAIEELSRDGEKRKRLAASGHAKVVARYTTRTFAVALQKLMDSLV